MPIREYKCPQCENKFEQLEQLELNQQAANSNPPCTMCGKSTERLFSAFFIGGVYRVPQNHLPKRLGGEW